MRRRVIWGAAVLAITAMGAATGGCGQGGETGQPAESAEGAASKPAPEPGATVGEDQGAAEAEPVDPAVAKARAEALEADTDEALAILKVMSDFLGGQPSLRFEADLSWDAMQVTGQRLEFGGQREILVRRPDRARVQARRRDGENAVLYFDGQRISIDLPDEEAYVSLEKPGTVDDAIDYLVEDLGTPVPLSDLVNADLYAEVAPRIVSGFWVGEEQIDDVWCDHIALRSERLDAQLWIEQGDRPVPHRLVLTYRDEPGAPQFRARLHGWDLSPETADSLFQFTPPEGAEQIPMRAALDIGRQEATR